MGSRDSWIDPEEVSELAGEVFPHVKKQRGEGEKRDEAHSGSSSVARLILPLEVRG